MKNACGSILATLTALCATIGVLALAAPASATVTHPFTGSFGPEGPLSVPQFSNIQGIAEEQSTGDVYVYDTGFAGGSVYKFNASGEPVDFSALGTNVITGVGGSGYDEQQIAVDGSSGPDKGDIYVANGYQLRIYGSSGDPEEVGGKPAELDGEGTPWGEPCGVAVDAAGNVYVGLASKSSVINEYTPTGKPVVNSDYVSSLWDLEDEVCNIAADPEGNVYADTWSGGPVKMYAHSQFSQTNVAAVGPLVDAGGSTVAADPSPSSHVLYVDEGNVIADYDTSGEPMRLWTSGASGLGVAGNAAGDIYAADGRMVEILGPSEVVPAQIDSEFATEVTPTSASLGGQINPNGADTTYYFQYGTENCTEHANSCITVPGTDLGSEESDQAFSTYVQGLTPDTTYHYRIVAHNDNGAVEGADHTFTTQAAESKFALPDGREYEMVSPPNKDGAETGGFNTLEGGLEEASEDGGAIAYVESAPIGENPPGSVLAAQILAKRSSGGWTSQDITTPHTVPSNFDTGHGQEYRLFSPDLSVGLVEPAGTTTLSPYAPSNERNLYLRNDSTGGYEPLVTTRPPEPFTGDGIELRIAGASPDLSHVVFTSYQALTATALTAEPSRPNLYEWFGGKLHLVNVLPDGKPTAGGAGLGETESSNTRNAVSDNSVIWTFGEGGSGSIYVRDMVTEKTMLAGNGEYQTASNDGSKIFFINEKYGNGADKSLYEFDVNGEKLNAITPHGARVKGVLGASEDGSSVYFVAEGVLAAGAQAGGDNLYVAHREDTSWAQPTFIATLASSDSSSWHGESAFGEDLVHLTSRVSPDGRYVAFMSSASLTGYDNRDALSGQRDVEVFLYDSAGAGRLVCASCNPTGARPIGEPDTSSPPESPSPIDQSGAWEGQWLAAGIPGWTVADVFSGLYQPRYLSDNGRLFFNSVDGLVAHDTNGKLDVYEYEPAGVSMGEGACTTASVTFSERADGCVALISAGTGSADSSFVDASVSGDDVFFLTRDRLLPQDYDNSYDLYDAHVCSVSAPCLAPASVAPPPCATGDACRAAPSPQPAIFGAPASATFSGAGNPVSSTAAHVVKPKKKSKPKKGIGKKGRAKVKRTVAGRKGRRAKRSRARSLTLTNGARR